MNEHEPVELRALRAERDTRDRVLTGAMARIRAARRDEPVPTVLAGAGRFLVPVLAAAAAVAFLLIGPADRLDVESERRDAGVLIGMAGSVPDPWLRWSLGEERPDPREVLVAFGEAP